MRYRALLLVGACLGLMGCGAGNAPPLVVFAAGSLARSLGAAADSFAARTGQVVSVEPAGSLDLARRITELGQVPDVIALADEDVFPKLLMPAHVTWYARFARNRMVLARAADRPSVQADSGWWQAIMGSAARVGRSDPDLDPGGYRALMLFDLAERHLARPGLAASLLAASPPKYVRPKSAELVALLQAGELDYAWMYESSARGARLPFDTFAVAIDLSREADSTWYATSAVRVAGAARGDTIEVRGAPIRYGLSIPIAAPRAAAGAKFVEFLLSEDGRRILASEYLDVLARPMIVGQGAPASLNP
ncbi:MAG: extracellular solute-binding protein [Gemmatimonadetes bacterium]|nr:extracellular solute-binding protein [Gemmatimonadota bacterium]